MKLAGNRYGKWLVLEDLKEKVRGGIGVLCKCDCGTIKKFMRAPFLAGHNSEKCVRCHLANGRTITGRYKSKSSETAS